MKQSVFIFILFIGALLRFTNLNWDSFQAFHPDEKNIAWAVTRIHWFDELNPKFFAYGGLPIYLYKILTDSAAWVTGDPSWTTEWGKIAVVGRYVSATLSLASILLIYLAGTRLFSQTVGVLAAFFLAVSPWAIREAHFATTETMLVFFLLLLLLLSLQRTLMLLGVIWGLAMGAKTTSLLFGVIPIAGIWRFPTHRIINTLRLLIIAASVFLMVSPYTVIDWTAFWQSMDYETGVALGRFSVPYTLQFEHTLSYLYQIQTMLWLAGPVGIIGIAGVAMLAFTQFRSYMLFLIFPTLYFLWSGSWYAKFARYSVPLFPFTTLAAAWLIVTFTKHFPRLGYASLIIASLITLLWGLANWTVYLQPQTRIQASRWIYDHVPVGAKLLTEHRNDDLPVDIHGERKPSDYPRELLTVYDEDTDEKMASLAAQLERADYLILSTRRIWGTMPRLTDRYPFTSKLYRKLLNGELGYKEVATFASYPSFLGVTINDDAAEETIQVFDHPTVRILKNTTPTHR